MPIPEEGRLPAHVLLDATSAIDPEVEDPVKRADQVTVISSNLVAVPL